MYNSFVNWLISFLCGGAITAIGVFFSYIKAQKKARKAMSQGIQALLRSDIIRIHDKYVEKGYCPVDIKEALHREYTAYHNLGGNDIATHLYEETIELPNSPET